MAAAAAVGMATGSSSSASFIRKKNQRAKRSPYNGNPGLRINAASTTTVTADPYQTLNIPRGASQSEVKKAFRRLALQYHPDVCREDNCSVNFHDINQAYDIVMNNLRSGESTAWSSSSKMEEYTNYKDDGGIDEPFRGMNESDSEWDLWEEWMGWEGAGIRDYSSHINPYI